MRTPDGKPVRLEDYAPTPYAVERVDLAFRLHPTDTIVDAEIRFSRRAGTPPGAPLELAGDQLSLEALSIDGAALADDAASVTPDRLVVPAPPAEPFTLAIRTRVHPTANTELMGLYRSSGNYCTQCEAEGFRRITYFYDRPDVLARYTVRIEADPAEASVLLANGNCLERGTTAEGRVYAVWHDPFPKPSYLFALVAGDLGRIADTFATASGRTVALEIYVERGKEAEARYAMDALKRAMRWDEAAFGREYDLDVFMIVAVSDFNMGAMENKGLNIFNDRYVLADPATATDQDYAAIEAIVAHEYFHNWTGNRITCRDWFQLCLKEGLTVFRDQEFTSDERSRPVKRIADVKLLRNHQFPEDAGPLAHPVRPSVYSEISNFYTATVYEKGAEVVRLIRTLVGPDAFRRGMDLFFERHDGGAVTVEDFLACFAEASGRDLSAVMRWYEQAGTPRLVADESWEEDRGRYTLAFRQFTPDTPRQSDKAPLPLPIRTRLLAPDAHEARPAAWSETVSVAGDVLVLEGAEGWVRFEGLAARPVPSLLRDFSAPVILSGTAVEGHEAALLSADDDPFNRWDAAQSLARVRLAPAARGGTPDAAAAEAGDALATGLAAILADANLDPAFKALALQIPGEQDLLGHLGAEVDPDAVSAAVKGLRAELGDRLAGPLVAAYEAHVAPEPYEPSARSAGLRSLRNTALDLLAAAGGDDAAERAWRHFEDAGNMTDRFAALSTMVANGLPRREEALAAFGERYGDEPLVLDKWFAVQARAPLPDALDRVIALKSHPGYAERNPNRLRALVGTFAHQNLTQFNRADGAGYRFVADEVIALDRRNPQVAARLLAAFRSFRMMEAGRRERARAELERVAATAELSSDTRDIVGRMLG